MSATVLTRVSSLLTAENLISGYAVKYFRYTDADTGGNTPFILFRQTGGGASDILLQSIQVTITIVHNPDGALTADETAQAIQRFLRGVTASEGIVRIDPAVEVRGPMYMENGRPVFELVARVFTEDL
jgi:hypothetical protein